MDITNVRYQFEHKMLPLMFYATRQDFFKSVDNNPELAYQVMKTICIGANMKIPYANNDFEFSFLKGYDRITILRLKLPEPERTPLCERIYFVTDDKWHKFCYYTIEKGFFGENRLCGWEQSPDMHINYGTCTKDTEVKKILEIFNSMRA